MKQCVKFPEDKFLAVRTCLVAICMGNRPAANLLSILLFRYNLRMENKDDAENQNAVKASKGESPDQDTSVRIFRTQAQLVEDMCGEITEKTLHDTAVPMLQLLGFLDLEEHMIANCYILHVDLVQQALNLYIPNRNEQPQLEKFLISTMQLEKFLITSDELEKFLIDRKNFLSGLEKVLIQNRKISNHQRGRKLATGATRKAKSQPPKNREEITKKNVEEKREDVSASASTTHAFDTLSEKDAGEEDTPLVAGGQFKQVVKGASNARDTHADLAVRPGDDSSRYSSDSLRAVSAMARGKDAAVERTQEKPKRGRKKPAEVQLTLHEQEIKQWYEVLRETEITLTRRNVAALRSLSKKKGTDCRENFLNVTALLDIDPWFEEKKIGVDLFWIDRQWESKYMYLQRKKPRLADKKPAGPPDFSKAELVDEQWNIYKIPGDDTEYTYWPLQGGKLMPVAEADLLGYNGGAGLYNVTQYKERAAKWPI